MIDSSCSNQKKINFEKVAQIIVNSFWVFVIGSVAGSIIETIVGIFQNGLIEIRQGLVYGPFVPVYGFGLLVYYFSISKLKGYKKIFFVSMILGGITEYIFSYCQEKLFGTVSWDYSDLMFNINGRTSLLHCIYWGGFGIAFVKYLLPILIKLEKYSVNQKFRIASVICCMVMIINVGISYLAGIRNIERKNNLVADNIIEEFIDKNYSEEFIDKLYARKIKIDGESDLFTKVNETFQIMEFFNLN